MALRAGGGPLVLRRDLGVAGPVQGQRAGGAAFHGARLAAPVPGIVRMRGQDGALSLRLAAGGAVYALTADAGMFSLSGQDAALRVARRLVGDFGAFTFTGQDAALRVGRRLAGDFGAFTFTGQDAALRAARRLDAHAALFALAGQDAALRVARQLLAEAGLFSLSGQDVAFVVPSSAVAVRARFSRRKAVLARARNAAAITSAQQTAQAVQARLTIRGDDRL